MTRGIVLFIILAAASIGLANPTSALTVTNRDPEIRDLTVTDDGVDAAFVDATLKPDEAMTFPCEKGCTVVLYVKQDDGSELTKEYSFEGPEHISIEKGGIVTKD